MASLIILAISEIIKLSKKRKERKRRQMSETLTEIANLTIVNDENLPSYANALNDAPPTYEIAMRTVASPEDAPTGQSPASSSTTTSQTSQTNASCGPYQCQPPIPTQVLDSIDWNQDPTFNTSVKPYHRHVFLCVDSDATNWPSEAAKLNELTDQVCKACTEATNLLVQGGMQKSAARIAFNITKQPSPESCLKFLIFPDAVELILPRDDVSQLSSLIASPTIPGATPLPEAAYGFVCVHNARDVRCGVMGPRLLQSMPTTLNNQPLITAGCSHVGGHKWAGNMVLYQNGKAKWFGRLHPGNLSETLQQSGDLNPSTCRGCFEW